MCDEFKTYASWVKITVKAHEGLENTVPHFGLSGPISASVVDAA